MEGIVLLHYFERMCTLIKQDYLSYVHEILYLGQYGEKITTMQIFRGSETEKENNWLEN